MPRFDRKQQSCQMESRIRFVAIGFRPAEFRRLEQRAICFQLPIDLLYGGQGQGSNASRNAKKLISYGSQVLWWREKIRCLPNLFEPGVSVTLVHGVSSALQAILTLLNKMTSN